MKTVLVHNVELGITAGKIAEWALSLLPYAEVIGVTVGQPPELTIRL